MNKQQLFHIFFNLAPYRDFIHDISESSVSVKSRMVCVANVHMLIEAYRDDSFAAQIRSADIVTPDGIPITWALRLLHGIRQERVAGMDLLPDLLKKAEEEKFKIFFYGGTAEMMKKTDYFISQHYPALPTPRFYNPPFRPLTTTEEADVIEKINSSGAHLVFVVLGCPKQEKWMASMKGRINCTMIGIGGALPVLVGMQKRAPIWMQQSGLEWLFRLAQDPKRLWKRYFVTNSMFIYLVAVDKVKALFNNKEVVRGKIIF